jgi:hypothetical protein
MSRCRALATAVPLALALLVAPTRASAQIAILPKIGFAGLGGDVAVALTDRLGVRGGLGFIPFEFEDVEIDDLDYTLTMPDFFATAGVDLMLAGPLRLSGGLLFRSGDFAYESVFDSETVEIGNETYTDVSGRLFGSWQSRTTSPFIAFGLGGTTGGGIGVFLDLGVAFAGDPEVTAAVDGDIASIPGIQAEVERERQSINDDIPDYAELWPFLQFGVKIGLGN